MTQPQPQPQMQMAIKITLHGMLDPIVRVVEEDPVTVIEDLGKALGNKDSVLTLPGLVVPTKNILFVEVVFVEPEPPTDAVSE